MAKIATLVEDFSAALNPAIWNYWGNPLYVYPSGGELILKNDPGTTNYHGISTQVGYDFTNSAVSVGLGTMANLDDINDPEYSVTVLNAEIDANNRYYWAYEGSNDLVGMKVVGGAYQYQCGFDKAATGINRVQIRMDGTNCYYEYSSDNGATWTIGATVAQTGVLATNLFFSISTGNWATIAGTYESHLLDVNSPPVVATANQNMLLMFQ
jgi:hypothetical protein